MFEMVDQKIELPPSVAWVFDALGEFELVVHSSAARRTIMGAGHIIDMVDVWFDANDYDALLGTVAECPGVEIERKSQMNRIIWVRYNGCLYRFGGISSESSPKLSALSADNALILPDRIVRAPRIGWLDITRRQSRNIGVNDQWSINLWESKDEKRLEQDGFSLLPDCDFDDLAGVKPLRLAQAQTRRLAPYTEAS
jgi:hypothetical protein